MPYGQTFFTCFVCVFGWLVLWRLVWYGLVCFFFGVKPINHCHSRNVSADFLNLRRALQHFYLGNVNLYG